MPHYRTTSFLQNQFQPNSSLAPNDFCLYVECDDPKIRDATPINKIVLRVAFTVWNNVMTDAMLDAAIQEFVRRYALYDIDVHVVARRHVKLPSAQFGHCLPPYEDDDMLWYDELMDAKFVSAVHVGKALNVFVGCQDKSQSGGALLGIATFPPPVDPLALTAYGGLWMNVVAMFPSDSTLLHESGHCLGLWHIFHGVDEIEHCSGNSNACARCCERPHAYSNDTLQADNYFGDFCSDTLAMPRDWKCSIPKNDSCDGASWRVPKSEQGPPSASYPNIMSYAMINEQTGREENCQTGFSKQQTARMHCFLRQNLADWIN